MTFSQGMDDFSRNATQAVDAACHTAEQVVKVGLESNPLYKEVSLLQQGAGAIGTMEPNLLRVGAQEIDNKLHQCGLLPHVHLGLDEKNNPTLTGDRSALEQGCFGYMHAPGFGDGQVMGRGRQDQSRGHACSDDSDNVIRDQFDGADRAGDNPGDAAHSTGAGQIKVHGNGTEKFVQDAKDFANTVIREVDDMAKNGWLLADPRL